MREVTVTVKTLRKFKLPTLPNFLRDEKGECISISELSQEQLREIGEKWTSELMKKARDKCPS